MADIHDTIDVEFDLVIPPEDLVLPPPESQIVLDDSEDHHEDHHEDNEFQPQIPEKGLTAWLYHMHLKTQLTR